MLIRDADSSDGAACAAIYGPYVADSVASFETVAPGAGEMAARITSSHCWLLAQDPDPIGYAYAAAHHERAAYRWAADVAIYIGSGHHRSGVGRALYSELFERLRSMGLWTLCAGITQPNAASKGLHEAMGFRPVGTYRRIGWKEGAWHDVQWWQLDLRPGDPGAPDEPLAGAGGSPARR